MSLLRKLFGPKEKPNAAPAAEDRLAPVDEAIRLARSGRISVDELIHRLLNGTLLVVTAEPVTLPLNGSGKWQPATVTKAADGSQWLLAFSDDRLAQSFAQQNPNYSYALCTEARWVLAAIPPNHGLLVNVGSEKMFEWTAEGLARYGQRQP